VLVELVTAPVPTGAVELGRAVAAEALELGDAERETAELDTRTGDETELETALALAAEVEDMTLELTATDTAGSEPVEETAEGRAEMEAESETEIVELDTAAELVDEAEEGVAAVLGSVEGEDAELEEATLEDVELEEGEPDMEAVELDDVVLFKKAI